MKIKRLSPVVKKEKKKKVSVREDEKIMNIGKIFKFKLHWSSNTKKTILW